jgi:hypothetical protein
MWQLQRCYVSVSGGTEFREEEEKAPLVEAGDLE